MLSAVPPRSQASRTVGWAQIRRPAAGLLRLLSAHADLLALLLFTCFLYFYLRLFSSALIDDAFITLDYVRNILRSGTWGFFPGHVANTATSPLNVILLTITSLLSRNIVESPLWLALCCFVAMAIVLDRLSLRLFGLKRFGRLATLALLLNPLLMSTLGLESILFTTFLVISLYCLVAGKWRSLAFVLGMLSLTRADGLLFAVVIMFVLPTTKIRLQSMGVLFLSILPWYLFSWLYLGSLVPDSLIIRTIQTSWQGSTFGNGILMYLRKYPAETILSFAYLPVLPAYLSGQVRDSRVLKVLLGLGLLHYLAYSALAVPPFHWYYVPEAAIIILFASFALGMLFQSTRSVRWQRRAAEAMLATAFLVPALGTLQLLARGGFRLAEMPIHSNLATQEQYREVGLWLKDNVHGKSVHIEGEIGTLAYYCDCLLLDEFSDRRWLTDGVQTVIAGHGPRAALYGLNFMFLREDAGFEPYSYLLTVRGDRESLSYPHVKAWETSTKWTPQAWILLGQY